MKTKHQFNKDLKKRHISFIALGAVIGTGLFLGSATAIRQAGPSVIFAYLLIGLVVFLIMRALGEIALQSPQLGTFSTYATNFIGPFAGYAAGWSYVFKIACVCLADIVAFNTYMAFWYPDVSSWIWTIGLITIVCAFNITTVKIYGELEVYFSIMKVGAILLMIVGGLTLLFIGLYHEPRSLASAHKLLTLSYWFPHSLLGFIKCLPIVIYAFGGIEILGITGPETHDPEKVIPRAINAIPMRIIFFYVITMSVLFALYPWQEIGVNGSPFVTICHGLGIPSAANLLNIIVLVAAASAINSDIYGSSRMLHSLAKDGHAFKRLHILSSRGTPVYAILIMLVIIAAGIVLNYFNNNGLFVLMADISAFAALVGWFIIVLSQLIMRLKMPKEEHANLKFPMPFWPLSSIIAMGTILFVYAVMSYYNKAAFLYGVIWLSYLVLSYNFLKFLKKRGIFKNLFIDNAENPLNIKKTII